MKKPPAGGGSAIRGQGLEWRYTGTTISCMFNPPHPGETLKEDILPALGLTVTEAAQQLGVTRTALFRVLNGHAAISPEMARRIEAWLGPDRGGRAELWLGMQLDYDLWIAEQKPAPRAVRAPELMSA